VNAPRLLRTILAGLAIVLLAGGCSADKPLNPSFPLTWDGAREDLEAMKADPRPLDRPVVVLGGIYDPGFAAPAVVRTVRNAAGGNCDVISVSFFVTPTFEDCRRRAIEAVEASWPSGDPDATIEVDVIGVSMGGLIARYAALPRTDGKKRLRVRHLYTISTPHLGAAMAGVPTLDGRIRDMRPGSGFMQLLNSHGPLYGGVLYPYVRLDDVIVGEAYAAPPGERSWWVANVPLGLAHMTASSDVRILCDIARRLRGDEAWSSHPAAPLPGSDDEAAIAHGAGD
jgi:hypothetical protein